MRCSSTPAVIDTKNILKPFTARKFVIPVVYNASVEIRVGPDVQPRHIADHVNTVRTLRAYQGLSGRVRLVLDKINAWIAGHPNVRPGSLAWETRREIEKLQAIVDARQRALNGANLTEAQRAALQAELAAYEAQLAKHTANLNTITNEPGRGYVAAEDTGSGPSVQQPSSAELDAATIPADGWAPPDAFHEIAGSRLPSLPAGWVWRRTEDETWAPMRPPHVPAAQFEAAVYGPDDNGIVDANIILLNPAPGIAEVVLSSTGTTRVQPGLRRTGYPIRPEDYRETFQDQNGNILRDRHGREIQLGWGRGHVLEHADTIPNPGGTESTLDRRNFVPEPRWWNEYVRSPLVRDIRTAGNGYRLFFEYDSEPRVTDNGTAIPSAEYFIEVAPDGSIVRAWRVPFLDPSSKYPPGIPRGRAALPYFEVTDHSTLPITPVIE